MSFPFLNGLPHSPASAMRRMARAVLLLGLLLAPAGWAQEALRSSLAGEAAVEAKKREMENQRFNLEWGPLSLRVDARLQTELTDNVRLTRTNRQEDISVRPSLDIFTAWRISEQNQLTLKLGGGYAKYLNATDYDNWFLSPNSDVDFDLYVGDFVINLHDRFTYTQEVDTDPAVAGIGTLSRFQNLSGVAVAWDLNDAKLMVGYDHAIYISQERQYSYQDYTAELFNARISFDINPTLVAGLDVGGGLKNREDELLNDNQHISSGPFVSAVLSEYATVRASAGYVIYFFDSTATATNESTADAFYLDIAFRQRVNAWLSQSLSVGRQFQSGDYTDTMDMYYIRHDAQWRVFREAQLGTFLSYERVKQTGQTEEKADRYGFGVSVARPLTEQLSGRVEYQFYLRNSDIDRDYLQNRLVLDLVYSF